MDKNDFCRTVNWYPLLGEHTALTGFLKLSADDLNLLAGGISGGKEVRNIISRIKKVMRGGSFDYYFVSTDVCAPTDTERFAAKRGAVHSAESAWRFLAASAKVRQAAADGNVEYLVFRPFIKIDKTQGDEPIQSYPSLPPLGKDQK